MLCQRSFVGVPVHRTGLRLVSAPIRQLVQQRVLRVRAAVDNSDSDGGDQTIRDAFRVGASVARGCMRAFIGAVSGCAALAALTAPAFAAVDNTDPTVLGPSTEMLLGAGDEFSFTSLLLYTLIGYWLIKAVQYLNRHSPDERDDSKGADEEQQQQQGGLTDAGRAPIRSYVDSSQPGPGGWQDARDLRNASLARSAAYRVNAAVRESIPRIHEMVEELAGSGAAGQWPLRRPRQADVDFVAAMVYDKVVKERAAKGPDAGPLTPRERAILETVLLEEVAEQCAREQVTEFIHMAAAGRLHPGKQGGGGGGAGHPPPSPAH